MINYFQFEIRPVLDYISKDNLLRSLRFRCDVDGLVREWQQVAGPRDYESMLDVYFDIAKKELRKALQEDKKP